MTRHLTYTDLGKPLHLTKIEFKVLVALRGFHNEHKRMPSSKELIHILGWKARGPLTPVVRRLEEKGALRYRPGLMPVELL